MLTELLSPNLDATQVGAKAAGVGRAIELGLAVPAGYVVTRAALQHFLEATGLEARVHALLSSKEDRVTRTECFTQLEADVLASDPPDNLVAALSAPATTLLEQSPCGLAVRSSGVLEDSATASFAGVYDSFLGVTSLPDFWDAVRRCWCAAWSPEATDYARKFGLEPRPDQMAVLVQEIILADAAGVIFTADPVTGDPWRFVLNSAFGLARDVVDGHAASDEFVLNWEDGRVLEQRVAGKPTMLTATPQGTVEVALPEARRNKASLADAKACEIARAVLALDRAYGCRVDMEWALAGDRLYVLQVRPMTALPDFFPYDLSEDEAKQTWRRSEEVWYAAPSQDKRLVAPLFGDVWALDRWRRYAPPDAPLEGEERDFNGYRYTTTWVWGRGIPYSESPEQQLIDQEPGFRALWEASKQRQRQEARQTCQELAQERSLRELIPLLLHVKKRAYDFEAVSWGPPQWLGYRCNKLLAEFLKEIRSAVPPEALVEGVTSLSYERTRALQRLAQGIGEEIVRRTFLDQPLDRVLAFLMEHHPGCRFLAEFEELCWDYGLAPPSWISRDEHTGIIGEVQTLFAIRSVLADAAADVEQAWDRSRARAAAAADEVRQELREKAALLARFERLLAWARYWVPALDDRGLCMLLFNRLKEVVWRTGRALLDEGITQTAEDIHLLTPADLRQIAESREARTSKELSRQRRREFEMNQRLAPPAFLGTRPADAHAPMQGALVPAGPQGGDGPVLSGRGMTPWTATGVTRAVNSLDDAALLASLTRETILVCDGSRLGYYADWVSLFLVVTGLVIVGRHGGMHHATQIARECGVAFVHLPQAGLLALPDGTPIDLNGAAGTVTIRANEATTDPTAQHGCRI